MTARIPAPTQSGILTALGDFLTAILPAGTPIIVSQVNRVPEPKSADFVLMTPLMMGRLATNIETNHDCAFTASISGNTMTVTEIRIGQIAVGQTLFGSGIALGTTVAGLGTGTGGIGTYTVSAAQSVASEPMASGTVTKMQPTMVTVQLDVYGPASADNVQTISTMFRDGYAVDLFAASGQDVAPLYCSDPRQMPFSNENQQIENRWTIDVVMQANSAISNIPQQFADEVVVTTINVEATYPQ